MDQVLQQAGSPIAPMLLRDMERRFDADFSAVRIHSGTMAAQSAREVAADAYTVGRNIVFGAGRRADGTGDGRRLLAHELAHVVQQRGASAAPIRLQRRARDPDEAAAITKEETTLAALAKRALASGKPAFAVHEVVWRLINAYGLDMHFELSGSRYDKGRKGVFVDFKGSGPRTTGTIVAGDDALQRVAKGDAPALAKEIEAQIGRVDTARGAIDYVFIMGKDAAKSGNKFYTEAKKFFTAEYAGATLVEDVRDLDGINQRINSGGKPVANLIIVSHAHPDGTLQLSLDAKDATPGKVEYAELKKANAAGGITQPKPDLVGFWTNVLIRGCNLGRSEEMLGEVRTAFGGSARVIAPTHGQRYGGGTESLADPFYEEPGASKLSDEDAFKRMKAKPEYAFVTDWAAMRKKLRRTTDQSQEVAYDGVFPSKGKELDLLRSQAKQLNVKDFTFGSSRRVGKDTVFTFTPKNEFKNGPVDITAETPPSDSEAIALAKENIARPSAYTFTVRRIQSGLKLKVVVDVVRTEWELHHAEIHKGGKGFDPRPGSKPWYGDTDY
ncbi:eCIS core domain-containing protein [Variovorax ginsengisoli]|uniref:DUF4157 domain-containing protein n=1 Tax=Variovorax ginsengisoli TaxID=363844 RepID=A0ABT8S5S1_9BURK|nr:DUF4157 domain-containing protein [Variovorax ginsengisoli]MDN8615096.1 DUF4157 domain-containing protein [Variovorax ginsengisoli]MDO1534266.1 DUF4157 domain-containing protein [Variovorax ginsengisoli]